MSVVWKRLSDIFFSSDTYKYCSSISLCRVWLSELECREWNGVSKCRNFIYFRRKTTQYIRFIHICPLKKIYSLLKVDFYFLFLWSGVLRNENSSLKIRILFFEMRKKISKLKTVGIVILVRVFYIDRFRLSAVFFVLHEWNCERRVLQ